MKLFNFRKRKELLRQYCALRREQHRVYARHNQLRPDLRGWEFKEYQETWRTFCTLRDELQNIACALGKYGKSYL